MLQSLASLSDDDFAAILGTVQRWCAGQKVDIDSADGRRAMQIAVNYIESSGSVDGLLEKLISALKQTDQNDSLAALQEIGRPAILLASRKAMHRTRFRHPKFLASTSYRRTSSVQTGTVTVRMSFSRRSLRLPYSLPFGKWSSIRR